MTPPTRPSFRPRMLARASILAAAAVLSVGATVHANEQQTDNNATTGNAANALVYELDPTSSKIQGVDAASGNGYFQIDDGTAAFNFTMRTEANGAGDFTQADARLFGFDPPPPGISFGPLWLDGGGVTYPSGLTPGFRSANVANVDGTYMVFVGTDTVAVFRPA
ncbi:MAG: hypothetical protein AAGF73_09895 [Actinomycetota bacterium]